MFRDRKTPFSRTQFPVLVNFGTDENDTYSCDNNPTGIVNAKNLPDSFRRGLWSPGVSKRDCSLAFYPVSWVCTELRKTVNQFLLLLCALGRAPGGGPATQRCGLDPISHHNCTCERAL